VAGLELVGMTGGREHAHPGHGERQHGLRRGRRRQRDLLPRDRLLVLETGGADIAVADAERRGDPSDGVEGRDAPLLDGGEDVLPLAARPVCRDLFDDEVLRLGLEDAADPRQIGGQVDFGPLF